MKSFLMKRKVSWLATYCLIIGQMFIFGLYAWGPEAKRVEIADRKMAYEGSPKARAALLKTFKIAKTLGKRSLDEPSTAKELKRSIDGIIAEKETAARGKRSPDDKKEREEEIAELKEIRKIFASEKDEITFALDVSKSTEEEKKYVETYFEHISRVAEEVRRCPEGGEEKAALGLLHSATEPRDVSLFSRNSDGTETLLKGVAYSLNLPKLMVNDTPNTAALKNYLQNPMASSPQVATLEEYANKLISTHLTHLESQEKEYEGKIKELNASREDPSVVERMRISFTSDKERAVKALSEWKGLSKSEKESVINGISTAVDQITKEIKAGNGNIVTVFASGLLIVGYEPAPRQGGESVFRGVDGKTKRLTGLLNRENSLEIANGLVPLNITLARIIVFPSGLPFDRNNMKDYELVAARPEIREAVYFAEKRRVEECKR